VSTDGNDGSTEKSETVPTNPTKDDDDDDEGEFQGYPFPFTHSSFLSRMLGGNSNSSNSKN